MSVVARLSVSEVARTQFTGITRMQPVLASDDPHDEEIKKFFRATPSGNVEIWSSLDAPLSLEPGEQVYLYLDTKAVEGALERPFYVSEVRLDGWATYVRLRVAPYEKEGRTIYEQSQMQFTIRNETAAEHFQWGSEFCAAFEKVPDAA